MTLTAIRRQACLGIVAACMALHSASQHANALITGGEGNEPVRDPGWPAGAAAVFNATGRVAYWEGPPLGGGEWHAECRGNAEALNRVLADFARIEAESRKLVIHDGIGRSVWLNINNEPEKRERAKIDWSFAVWQPDSWKRLKTLPERFRPPHLASDDIPPPMIDVYVGFNINWDDVRVPEGIEVVDQRLQAHGFTLSDGTVLEGTVLDAKTRAPLNGVAHLERIETKAGKYEYSRIASATADAAGHWVMKSVPAGWYQIVLEADNRVSRIAGYQQLDGSPHWAEISTTLAEGGTLTGRVRNHDGAPLADVAVRLDEVVMEDGDTYRTSHKLTVASDADGRFEFRNVPVGKTRIRVHKPGYVGPGLGESIDVPAETIELTMQLAANARVKVDFGTTDRPDGYIVEMEPEGGNVVGSYGGSANLPENNTYEFQNVPAGKYVFFGRPNPGSQDQETDRVTVELRGGETTTVTLKAR